MRYNSYTHEKNKTAIPFINKWEYVVNEFFRLTEKDSVTKLKLRTAIEKLPFPIIIIDSGNTIQMVNMSAKTITGNNKLLGQSTTKIFPERIDWLKIKDNEAPSKILTYMKGENGEPLSFNCFYRDIIIRNEKYVLLSLIESSKNNKKHSGESLQIHNNKISKQDTSEKEPNLIPGKKSSAINNRSTSNNPSNKAIVNKSFNLLLEALPDMVFVLDTEGNIIDFNEAVIMEIGYSTDDILKINFLGLIEAEGSQKFKAYLQNIHQMSSLKLETYLLRDNDITIPVELNSKFVTDNDDTFIVCTVRDLSKSRQFENELISAKENALRKEQELNAIFNSVSQPIFLLDNQLRISQFNKVASDIFNISDERKPVASFGDFIHCTALNSNNRDCGVSEKCSTCTINKFKGLAKQNETATYQQEITLCTDIDHPEKQNLALATIKVLNFSNEIKLMVTLEDITDQKNSEFELKNAKEAAEESNRLKTTFLNNLSHELRTPLNGILGFSELLINSNDPTDSRQFAEVIHKSGKRLLYVVDDLFTVSSILSKSVHVNTRRVNLSELLSDTEVILYEEKLIAENNDITIKLSIPENIGEHNIELDLSIYIMIIKKLAKNAFKFTPKGTVEFGMEFNEFNEPVFYLKDTGIGIEPDKVEKIFQFFRQGEEENTRSYGGIGSGLSIAKGLLELINGKIWLESRVGEGSTFYFYIPTTKTAHEKSIPPVNIGFSDNKLEGKTILIVEDNDFNYFLLEAYFENSGAKIMHAPTGEKAIEIIKSPEPVDLVLMDLRLPDINGFVATSIIKKYRPDLKIIAQSALSSAEDIQQALKAGCDDFIKKPINCDHLLQSVFKVLV